MDIKQKINFLEKEIKDPRFGLPEEIFLFASRIVPMVNVDLLIKDENGRTLLSWRNDEYAGKGWHIPGGIIRFKEKFETRVQKVAEKEIKTKVKFNPIPVAINEVMCNKDSRGHFISILYKCFLSNKFVIKNNGLSEKSVGYLKWHDSCPKDILKVHKIYEKYI